LPDKLSVNNLSFRLQKIIFCVGLINLLIFVNAAEIQAGELTLSECNQVANNLNQQLPMAVDQITTLKVSGCVTRSGAITFFYNYAISDSVVATQTSIDSLRSSVLKSWCTDPAFDALLNGADLIAYRYYFTSGAYIGEYTFSSSDC